MKNREILKISALLGGILMLAGLVNSTFAYTIPIEIGNKWEYSYSVKMVYGMIKNGTLRFSISSITKKGDSTYLKLSIQDSGLFHTRTAPDQQFNNFQTNDYLAFKDTIASLDTLHIHTIKPDPGDLLSFRKHNDSTNNLSADIVQRYIRTTDSISCLIENQRYTVYNRFEMSYSMLYASSFIGCNYDSVLCSWAQGIGMLSYYHHKYGLVRGSQELNDTIYCLLTSFNNIPIHPVGVRRQYNSSRLLSLPALKQKRAICFWGNENMAFEKRTSPVTNLRGQAIRRVPYGRSILIIGGANDR